MTTRIIVTSDELGYRGGDDFSDISSAGDLEKAVIGRIVIHYDEFINSLTVYPLIQHTRQTLSAD